MQKVKNQTLENCLNIIENAINNGISLTKASILAGYGKNYVSNMKLSLEERVTNKLITKTDSIIFTRSYKKYEKTLLVA